MATGLFVWSYFEVNQRLTNLETATKILGMDVDKNSEFRIRWPRGEIGSLPADAEQYLLISSLQSQVADLIDMVKGGEAPHDQQQELRLSFLQERLTAIEAQVVSIKDKQLGLLHRMGGEDAAD